MKKHLTKKHLTFDQGRQSSHVTLQMSHVLLVRGVSLMELLIYIALLSVILLVISSSFISISKTGGSVDARTEVNSNTRFASNRIIQDIKSASAVSVPAVVGGTAATLEITISGDTILYDVSAGQLRRKVNAGTPEPITSNLVTVSTPTFTRLENYNNILQATTTAIDIGMTISHANTGSDYNYSSVIDTTASLR